MNVDLAQFQDSYALSQIPLPYYCIGQELLCEWGRADLDLPPVPCVGKQEGLPSLCTGEQAISWVTLNSSHAMAGGFEYQWGLEAGE